MERLVAEETLLMKHVAGLDEIAEANLSLLNHGY